MSAFDTHYPNWKTWPKSEWRWPNFSPAEMACGDGSLKINADAMDRLQRLRDLLGKPIQINSSYRSRKYNRDVGGVPDSMHIPARAFDCGMKNFDPAAFETAAREVGFTGFGFYPSQGFMHIDSGNPRSWGTRFAKRDDNAFHAPENPTPELARAATGRAAGAAGGVALATGAATAAAPLAGALGQHAQTLLIAGIVIAGIAALFLFRDQIRAMFGRREDI